MKDNEMSICPFCQGDYYAGDELDEVRRERILRHMADAIADESDIPLVEIDRLNRKHLGLDHPDRIAELAKYIGCPVGAAYCLLVRNGLLREKGGA